MHRGAVQVRLARAFRPVVACGIAVAAVAPLLRGQGAVAEVPREVAAEWELRGRALDLAGERAALDAALAGSWSARRGAFDAIARGLAIGESRADVRAWAAAAARRGAGDAHPNVRAAALAVLGVLSNAELSVDVEALANDPFPEVRAALVRALEGIQSADAYAVLSAAVSDPDERVATAALRSLFAAAEPAGDPTRSALVEAQLEVLTTLAETGETARWIEACRTWSRRGATTEVPRRFLAWTAAKASSDPSGGALPRVDDLRAVAAALALAGGPDAGAEEVREEAALLTALLDGWLGEGAWDPRRQALLVEAGRAASDGVRVALLDALERACGEQTAPADERFARFQAALDERRAGDRQSELIHLRFDLFEALLLPADGAAWTAREIATRKTSAACAAFLLPELGLRVDGWDAARDATWLAPTRAVAVRIAAAEAFANTLATNGDGGASALLTHALADSDAIVRRIAFRSLCQADHPPLAALRAAWDAADLDVRGELLAWLPRGRPLSAFRDVLLGLAVAGGPHEPAAIELLGPLAAEENVRAKLLELLEAALSEVRAVSASEVGDVGGSGIPRATELRVTGLLRALARVELDVEVGAAALGASLGRSTEIGKVAAALLARTDEPTRLLHFLGDDVDRRTRIEAAIGIATRVEPTGDGQRAAIAAAIARIAADLDHAAWDLRVRMIDALGAAADDAAPDDVAIRLLASIAVDPDRAPEDRKRALEALAANAALDAVRRTAGEGRDVEVRIVALRLLAAAGEDLAPLLAALHADDPPDGVRLGDAERERLILELLRLGAVQGSLTGAQEAALLAGPLAEAARHQSARFLPAGARPGVARIPDPDFAWRQELDALALIAEAGRLARIVDADARARLDGRFLGALGERALAREAWEPGREVLRAAWVALQSDVDVPAAKVDAVRCRLLGAAWATERYEEAALLAELLLADRRAFRIGDAVWEASFGVPDAARGVDPDARVAASVWQARAFAAIAAGEFARARELAERARLSLGGSTRAAREQERLEAALEQSR